MQDTQVRSLGQEDPLEKEMATHSSILAWEIPRTEEPGGLQSMGSRLKEENNIPFLKEITWRHTLSSSQHCETGMWSL